MTTAFRRARVFVAGAVLASAALVAAAPPAQATAPGLNGRLVFDRYEHETNTYQVMTVNESGTGLTTIRSTATFPRWSSVGKGTTVGFVERFGPDDVLMLMDPDGTNVRLTGVTDETIFWSELSPDGTRVAWTDTDLRPVVSNVDGTDQHYLSEDPTDQVFTLNWSPDGSAIVYTHSQEGWIQLVNADGTNDRTIFDPAGFDSANNPSFSPNRTRLIFDMSVSANGAHTPSRLYTINVDGSRLRQVGPTDGANFCGAFSPDGRKIAFVRSVNNVRQGIFVMNANGTDVRQITTDRRHDCPSWLPNVPAVAVGTVTQMSPLTVFATAVASYDTDGKIVSILWQWGDTTTSTTRKAWHTYSAPGTYIVRLTVTDDDGVKTNKKFSLTVT